MECFGNFDGVECAQSCFMRFEIFERHQKALWARYYNIATSSSVKPLT